jgi:hypothetical protein
MLGLSPGVVRACDSDRSVGGVDHNGCMPLNDPYLFPGERTIVPGRAPRVSTARVDRKADRDGVVYGLSCRCHPTDGIRYVGQTKRQDPADRFREHLRVAAAGTNLWQAVYEWIPEHTAANIVFDVIESGIPADQLNYRELSHIRGLRSAGNHLTNQDDFWWVDAAGVWQHTWPNWPPFNAIEEVSYAFVQTEFARGIYPLTFSEYAALFPGTERQTVAGLAGFLTDEGRALVALWRRARPTIEELATEDAELGPEDRYVLFDWARQVRSEHNFPVYNG